MDAARSRSRSSRSNRSSRRWPGVRTIPQEFRGTLTRRKNAATIDGDRRCMFHCLASFLGQRCVGKICGITGQIFIGKRGPPCPRLSNGKVWRFRPNSVSRIANSGAVASIPRDFLATPNLHLPCVANARNRAYITCCDNAGAMNMPPERAVFDRAASEAWANRRNAISLGGNRQRAP